MLKLRDPAKICSRIGIALAACMLVWYAGAVGGGLLMATYFPEVYAGGWGMWLINDVPMYLLGLPVFLLIIFTIPDGPVPQRTPARVGVKQYLLTLVFCFGSMYVISALRLVLPFAKAGAVWGAFSNPLAELVQAGDPLPAFLFGVLTPALGEEFIFRYVLYQKLRGCGDKIYMLISGLTFGLFHTNLVQGGYAFILGATFAWLYAQTGNIWLPVSLHFIINAFGLVVLPALIEYELAIILLLIYIAVMVVGAILIAALGHKRVSASLMPPWEAGWPYKPPKAAPQPVAYQGAYWQQPAANVYPALQPYPSPPQAYPAAYTPPPVVYAPPAPPPPPPVYAPPAYPYQNSAPYAGQGYAQYPPVQTPMGQYTAPYVVPAAPPYQPVQPYGWPQPQYYAPPPKGMGRVCIVNAGMLTYIGLTGLITAFNILGGIALLVLSML